VLVAAGEAAAFQKSEADEAAALPASLRLLGLIAIADAIRPDAAAAVAQLKRLGVERVVMLTGDNWRVAEAIGRQAGVDDIHAGLLPEEKMAVIGELKKHGPVAMVGDGINDAPALAAADVGFAMGAAGTDIAMESADVVLMSHRLDRVAEALSMARRARRVVWQNLAFAVAVMAVLVVSALGFELPLPLGVLGHEGSTVLVCLNGLRLLGFRGEGGRFQPQTGGIR
jgi:Cd2+/Zn2+-exporting ATPase